MPRTRSWLRAGLGALAALALFVAGVAAADSGDAGKLRLLVIGAHPDDPDKCGGTMARYVELGHTVKFVSLTNGDAGHQNLGGGPLARIRTEEARCAGEAIDSEYITLDNHDGELMPTLEMRRQVITVIREFKPDMVFTPRVDDYHPDHRATGELVRDSAYMVTVPNVVAKTPHLRKNPVFVNVEDRFSRPAPFDPVIVVDIGSVVEKKVDGVAGRAAQGPVAADRRPLPRQARRVVRRGEGIEDRVRRGVRGLRVRLHAVGGGAEDAVSVFPVVARA